MSKREIKFRAWDTRTKLLVTELTVHSYSDGSMGIERQGSLPGETEDFELMQYTGLKDKNGKEIYEGDIVKVDKETQKLISEPRIVSVVWGDDEACFKTSNGRYLWLVVGKSYNSGEVIGNIYENPELGNDIHGQEY